MSLPEAGAVPDTGETDASPLFQEPPFLHEPLPAPGSVPAKRDPDPSLFLPEDCSSGALSTNLSMIEPSSDLHPSLRRSQRPRRPKLVFSLFTSSQPVEPPSLVSTYESFPDIDPCPIANLPYPFDDSSSTAPPPSHTEPSPTHLSDHDLLVLQQYLRRLDVTHDDSYDDLMWTPLRC